ncbi:hypothetical protein CEXT_7701 [Caerostris extrusa]|uniref:Uncharacterized protein n=1 Tax=Caerostris extrusa TaxID=172846 RepID=A0AAV4XTS6_CAEEX|nr:hypothetical protein CEXT_7701 [Caerostris extrusa]
MTIPKVDIKALRLWLLNQKAPLVLSPTLYANKLFLFHILELGVIIHLHLQIFHLWKTIPGRQPARGGIGVKIRPILNSTSSLERKASAVGP